VVTSGSTTSYATEVVSDQAELANLVHCVESSTRAWSEAFTLRGGGGFDIEVKT